MLNLSSRSNVEEVVTTPVMELSIETPDDAFTTFRRQKIDTFNQLIEDSDVIDLSKVNFSGDEDWLRECSSHSDTNLNGWLYNHEESPPPVDDVKLSIKNIDTRTFTRPKKRFTRPSIEKYNEELYGNDLKELTDSGIQLNGCSQDDSPIKPVQFELGQTVSSVYFENILSNSPAVESFQNMSPPSLVNSMCSSTFTNLMESSFIKNDPVLREIRDTDFTGSILQQEAEPMFQSITESYSSLNSDVPENFLKKVSFTEEDGDTTVVMHTTYDKGNMPCNRTVVMIDDRCDDFQDANNEDLNTTYQRKPIGTMNSTFQRRKNNKSLNSTVTIEPEKTPPRDDRTIENVKRLLDRRPSPSLDLNRLSYLVDRNDQINATFTNESPKRNSFGSTDSGENLDYMSLSSGSSKSSKVHSTDALVDAQDQKFSTFRKGQIMSTPKPRQTALLWPNHEISPIGDRNSDPELSSSEQAPAVMQNSIRKQKSVSYLNQKMPSPKSSIRGSHPNLKLSDTRTLTRTSNLHSMGHTLKGSYTSLKPMNPNLPVAPPPLDTTVTKAPAVAQVSPVPREVPMKSQDAQFVKPQPPRSGLPRPVTGIPRPVSRIPGPRNIRPVSKSAGQQGRL